MTYYQEQISKIKEHGSKDFININSSENTIVLKLVDDSDETANLLTEWRKKFKNMFATNFGINKERTKNWIRDSILKNPDRILFIIYFNEKKVGTIGTALYDEKTNSAHIDTVMKDPSCNYPPLISLVEKIYLKWMFDGLKLSKIQGLLFRDNFPALVLHLSCGFQVVETFPIKKILSNDGWVWKKIDPKSETNLAERYFSIIELSRENLIKNMDEIDSKMSF